MADPVPWVPRGHEGVAHPPSDPHHHQPLFILIQSNQIPATSVADTDPSDPLFLGTGSGSGSFYHQEKIVRKTLIPTALRLLFDFLSLKNDVNVPYLQKVPNQQKNFSKFFVGILNVDDENSRIRIRIRIHLSEAWIRGSRSRHTPKCHGSATLPATTQNLFKV